ncbi:hypothetical protein DM02DRAFT_546082 [Neofusicoccum parvum]|uniref:Uncharacterized protein n=1 Tax=Neofusicoccum parvum TaxID=310453 RepID=A0ACB5SN32_9PEZI|nr:hypothetical protein DM02DRAFT_546082 [Neofusicoccum parvum]
MAGQKYIALQTADPDLPLPEKNEASPKRYSTWSKPIGAIIMALAIASIILTAWDLSRPADDSHAPSITHCGSSPQEAMSRGCKFEVHNFAWVPAACYDDELSDEWDHDESWRFATTDNGTDLIATEEVMKGLLTDAWVPWRQHLAHCTLIWKKYQRAVMNEWPMENWTSSYMHTAHCAMNLNRWDLDPEEFNSHLYTKYPVCDYSWRNAKAEPQTELHHKR